MKNDLLVPAPLLAAAICVSVSIACMLLGDATGLYPTVMGSSLMHGIYYYDPNEAPYLQRYLEAEGDSLFVVLAMPLVLALGVSVLYHAIVDVLHRRGRTLLAPAE